MVSSCQKISNAHAKFPLVLCSHVVCHPLSSVGWWWYTTSCFTHDCSSRISPVSDCPISKRAAMLYFFPHLFLIIGNLEHCSVNHIHLDLLHLTDLPSKTFTCLNSLRLPILISLPP